MRPRPTSQLGGDRRHADASRRVARCRDTFLLERVRSRRRATPHWAETYDDGRQRADRGRGTRDATRCWRNSTAGDAVGCRVRHRSCQRDALRAGSSRDGHRSFRGRCSIELASEGLPAELRRGLVRRAAAGRTTSVDLATCALALTHATDLRSGRGRDSPAWSGPADTSCSSDIASVRRRDGRLRRRCSGRADGSRAVTINHLHRVSDYVRAFVEAGSRDRALRGAAGR